MHLEVSFRNLNPRDEVRQRAQALFKKMEHFLDPAAEGQLIVAVEHGSAIVEMVVHTRGATFKSQEEDPDLRASLDKAMHSMENQLRRSKEKRVNRKGDSDLQGFEEADEEPTVV